MSVVGLGGKVGIEFWWRVIEELPRIATFFFPARRTDNDKARAKWTCLDRLEIWGSHAEDYKNWYSPIRLTLGNLAVRSAQWLRKN